jgi:NADH-quinone oxidoreductase subunit M
MPVAFMVPLLLAGERHSLRIATASSAVVFLLSMYALYLGAHGGFGALSFSYAYLPSLGISASFQLTGYSGAFLVLSAIVLLCASICAGAFVKESHRIYGLLFLLAEASALGLFLSGSLFMFFAFWELGDIAMFFMIHVFGGLERRHAAIKFLVYSTVASLALLLGIIVICANVPTPTFDISSIVSQSASIPQGAQFAAMILLLLAFLIKMPVFPFHSWLESAQSEAPATAGMLQSGMLLKAGAYGLILLLLMLPLASTYAKYLAVIFGFSALYASLVAIRQSNLKRIAAYVGMVGTGVAAIGLVSLNPVGTAGGVYLLLGQGLASAMLFLVSGAVDESYGTPLFEKVRGVMDSMPSLAYSFIFCAFAFIGLPLTGGFVGYLLSASGAFKAYGIAVIVPLAAVALSGAFLFLVVEKSFAASAGFTEPFESPRRVVYVAAGILACATVVLGILPGLLLAPLGL